MAPKIGLAVLAAGLSRRFGPQDKLMAPLDGRPLCDHIAQTTAAFDAASRLAICASGSATCTVFTGHGFGIIENPHPDEGLSGSLKLAASHAHDTGLDALIICLADMPFVPLTHLERLRARWLETGRPKAIASRATASESWITPPAIFSATTFRDLLATSGDTGARALLKDAATVEVDAASLSDFDTIGDFGRAKR